MIKHWTDKELTEELKKLTVICDTREQVNNHVTEYFTGKKIPYTTRKLDAGDYSAQIGDMSFERDFVVERKHNLDEICGNLTADRDRFEREFMRLKSYGTKCYLIIENATWGDVYTGNYRSKLNSKSLLASLLSWQTRYNVTIIFTDSQYTGRLIYGIMYYAAREILQYGNR